MRHLWFLAFLLTASALTLPACDSGEEKEGLDTEREIGCDDPEAIAFRVRPKATYLRTASTDRAEEAPAYRLSDRGLAPGDSLNLQRLGEYQYRTPTDPDSVRYGILAVFSSTSTLLDADQPNRVPGAIDAGEDYVTGLTNLSPRVPTDIAEDFAVFDVEGVNDTETIVIPDGAVYLFVSPEDNSFGDNQDEDGDFRLCVEVLN